MWERTAKEEEWRREKKGGHPLKSTGEENGEQTKRQGEGYDGERNERVEERNREEQQGQGSVQSNPKFRTQRNVQ